MGDVLERLGGGDLRSEGQSAEVARELAAAPEGLAAIRRGLAEGDRLIRARCCMTLEVLSRTRPELVAPLVPALLDLAERETAAPALWHVAEVLAAAPLEPEQVRRALPLLLGWLGSGSRILVHCAVLALGAVGPGSGRESEVAAALEALPPGSKGRDRAVAEALARLTPDETTR